MSPNPENRWWIFTDVVERWYDLMPAYGNPEEYGLPPMERYGYSGTYDKRDLQYVIPSLEARGYKRRE